MNAYEVRQAGCLLQVKLCDPCLSALKWFVYHARRYTSARLLLYLLSDDVPLNTLHISREISNQKSDMPVSERCGCGWCWSCQQMMCRRPSGYRDSSLHITTSSVAPPTHPLTDHTRCCCCHLAPAQYNTMATIVTCSTDSFKRSLKTFLFQSVYDCETRVS